MNASAPPPAEAPPASPQAPPAAVSPVAGPEGARQEISRLRADVAFMTRYNNNDEEAREIMQALHATAFPDPFARRPGDGGEAEPQQPRVPERLLATTDESGVDPADWAHLRDVQHTPPDTPHGYKFPPTPGLSIDNVAEIQNWAHSAALPQGYATAIVERASKLEAYGESRPVNGPEYTLAERGCDANLERAFGERLDEGWDALGKLARNVEKRHPGLMETLDRAGVLTDSYSMTLLIRHALALYARRG